MPKESELRVFVALINDAGQVLIIKRSAFVNNPGQLGLPGGHRDEGETLEQGARRELSEELGIDIDFETRSYVKVHADKKRVILLTQMPPSSDYRFNLDQSEVAAVYWTTVKGLVAMAREQDGGFHKSLELALPILLDLKPTAVYGAFAHVDHRTHLLEVD
jgi:8-oxo-dGTP pyrophosphatase MutT (NUDIX family)